MTQRPFATSARFVGLLHSYSRAKRLHIRVYWRPFAVRNMNRDVGREFHPALMAHCETLFKVKLIRFPCPQFRRTSQHNSQFTKPLFSYMFKTLPRKPGNAPGEKVVQRIVLETFLISESRILAVLEEMRSPCIHLKLEVSKLIRPVRKDDVLGPGDRGGSVVFVGTRR